MKIKDASVKTSTICFLSFIVLASITVQASSEGGPAAQGALIFIVSILPILFFTSVAFPAVAILTQKNFSSAKWIGFNFSIVLLVSLLFSVVLSNVFGVSGLFTFLLFTAAITASLFLPSLIWLKIALSQKDK
jgi:hypothetical protein